MESSPKKKRLKEISPKISKEEMIRRLKAATKELSSVNQEEEDRSQFHEFAVNLAAPFILENTDRDVKSFAACCLADVLRIYAPEPPYDRENLIRIFRMILDQLKYLRDVDAPSYKRYFYVLESIALVKTFNVCIELDAQDVILAIFKLFFTIISERHSARVKTFMLEIMSSLIQEGENLPQNLLDLILINLVPPNSKRSPEAYHLASTLIDRCSSTLEPYIQLFFNKVMVLQNSVDSVLEDQLYPLIYELFKINKTVLLSVIPQLEYKLKSDEEAQRIKTVKLLSLLFSEEDSSLTKCNKALWHCYLGRFSDISSSVRLACIKSTKQFLLSEDTSVQDDMVEQLEIRLQDPDEKVRLETIITICELASEDFDSLSKKLFNGVIDRIMDKKWSIRREAVTWIGRIYQTLSAFRTPSKKDVEYITLLPSKILHLYQQNNNQDRLLIERVFFGCLLPVTLPTEVRMQRFFSIYISFDETSLEIFNLMLKQRSKINKDLLKLLDAHSKKDKNLTLNLSISLAKYLPDSQRAQGHIMKLLDLCKNKNLHELLLTSCNVDEGCSVVLKCISEIVKIITVKSPAIETVKSLLDRACPMLIDTNSFKYFVNKVKNYLNEYCDEDEDDDAMLLLKGKRGLKFIETLSNLYPILFHSQFGYEVLKNFLVLKDVEVVERGLHILLNIIHKLKETDDDEFVDSLETILMDLLLKGSPKQTKYALQCLNIIHENNYTAIEELMEMVIENLNTDVSSRKLQCALVAIGELALLHPTVFEKYHSIVIRDFVIKEIVMVNNAKETLDDEDEDDEWIGEDELKDETKVKIYAIKLMKKWLSGLQKQHMERSKPVFRLLMTILNNDGNLLNDGKINAKDRSHLRLAASFALLKLVQNVNYVRLFTVDHYLQLSLTIQDSCYEVREKFTVKLNKALESLKLPLDYFAYLVLVAADPVRDRRQKVKQLIIRNTQARRDYMKLNPAAASRPFAVLPEYSLPYVVYLLAHHPDFVPPDVNSLLEMKDYLWFFLEPILGTKGENYSFIKKLFENIKQTKDVRNPDSQESNERLYIVCDIAIGCVMCKNQNFNLKDFPGDVVLPKKLFQYEKNLNNTKSYIPNDLFAPLKKKPLLDLGISNSQKKTRKVMSRKKRRSCPDDEDVENYELLNRKGTVSRPNSSVWYKQLNETDVSDSSFIED